MCLCPSLLFSQRRQSCWPRAHVTTSVHFNDLLKGPVSSPHSQGPGVRASTYGFGGTEFSPSQLGTSFSGHSTNGDGVRWRGRGTVTVTPRFGVAWRRLLGSGLWSPGTGSPVTGARVPECHLAMGHSSVCSSQPCRDHGFICGRLVVGSLCLLRAAGQTPFQTRSVSHTPEWNTKHVSLIFLFKIALAVAVMNLRLMTVLALSHTFGSSVV